MKEIELKPCPCCGNTKRVRIEGRSSTGWGCLFIYRCGSVDLQLCLNCGCVYMDSQNLEFIKKQQRSRQ